MRKMKKRLIALIPLLIFTLVMGAILILSVYTFFEREGEISFGGLIRAETLYIIIVFLIFIPVLLGALLLVMVFVRNKPQKDADIDSNLLVVGADGNTRMYVIIVINGKFHTQTSA